MRSRIFQVKFNRAMNKAKETVEDNSNDFVFFVGTILLIAFVFLMAYKGADRQEMVECKAYLAQKTQFNGFFVSSADEEMCTSHGIDLN